MIKNKQKSITYHLFFCATKLATKVAQNKVLTVRLILVVNFEKKDRGKQIIKFVLHKNDKEYQGNVKEYQISGFISGNILLRIQFEDISSLYCQIIKLTTPK